MSQVKTSPQVSLIADSINEMGDRLSTFELKYWRPILPEMNTHRVFSRNAASSRAESFDRRCRKIMESVWCPAHWNAEQRGMMGGDEFFDDAKDVINNRIAKLAEYVIKELKTLDDDVYWATGNRIHKQYLNRYLEPFIPVTQLVSATDWENFFKLRLAPDAQPEIRDVAKKMKELLDTHVPQKREVHLPYITDELRKQLKGEDALKVSVARCARVSYGSTFDEKSLDRDIRLFEQLRTHGHWSPFEHIAFADPHDMCPEGHRNYTGWVQYRSSFDI